MKKQRAKWGSKTRHGKAIIPSDGSIRPYIADNVRPRIPKEKNGYDKKLNDAKVLFAMMIVEGQDKQWTPFMRDAVKNILF